MTAHDPNLDLEAANGTSTSPRSTMADWLSLAAAPTFAIMALITSVLGGGPPNGLCSGAQDASALNGMALMYVLMSVLHLGPWLKLVSGRRSGARRC